MFSPDRSRVISGSQDNIVRIWNTTTRTGEVEAEVRLGEELLFLEGHMSWVTSVASLRMEGVVSAILTLLSTCIGIPGKFFGDLALSGSGFRQLELTHLTSDWRLFPSGYPAT